MKDPRKLDENLIGSFNSHVRRKKVLENEDRYAVLYSLSINGEVRKRELYESMDMSEEDLENIMKPLLDTNLVSRIPSPDDNDIYKITRLGLDEIPTNLIEEED